MTIYTTLKSLSANFHRVSRFCLPVVFVLGTLSQGEAHAEIFKSVDKNGKVVYTDRPSPSDKNSAVELPVLNTQPAIQATTAPPPRSSEQAKPTYLVEIISPTNQSQIPMGQRQVPVSLKLTPQLSASHLIQLHLDGQPFGAPSHSTQLVLDDLHRGEHTLTASVIDEKGKELNRSASVLLYVQRPSALN